MIRNCFLFAMGILVLGCPAENKTITDQINGGENPKVSTDAFNLPLERRVCVLDEGRIFIVKPFEGFTEECGRLDQGWTCQGTGDDLATAASVMPLEGTCFHNQQLAEATDLAVNKSAGKADDFSSSEVITLAIGECAPPYLTVCADVVPDTVDGEPFNGFVLCSPHRGSDGQWTTTRVPQLCPTGTQCLMSGEGLQLAMCEPVTECDVSTPCPDTGNPCTASTCSEQGFCEETLLDGIDCNDGNACTADDMCAGGSCAGTSIECDDGNDCTVDTCNPASGCDNTELVPDGTECSDGNLCTESETCVAGICVAADPNKCDDEDECNGVYSCNPADGSCTEDAPPPTCEDENPCTDNFCNPGSGCDVAYNTNPCDDENLCTWGDVCAGGSCAGTPVDYNDGDLCNGTESCDPDTGMPVMGTPVPNNEDPDNLCTEDVCDPGTGEYAHNAYEDGTFCDPSSMDPEYVCIDGVCADPGSWCNADSQVGCQFWDDAGLHVGELTCDIPVGELYGTWESTECPGAAVPDGTWTCINGTGCLDLSSSTVEANHCQDGVDNDGDGDMDCADSDCYGVDPACPAECEDDAQCDDDVCYMGACCTRDCEGKQCDDDGCGGTCAPGCDLEQTCNEAQLCVSACVPDCEGKECGPDGCGDVCAPDVCPEEGQTCNDLTGQCVLDCDSVTNCADKECGSDGCGDSCGDCMGSDVCDPSGTCTAPPSVATLDVQYLVDASAIPAGAPSLHLLVECDDAVNNHVVTWGSKDSVSPVPDTGTIELNFNHVGAVTVHHCKVNVAVVDGASSTWWAAGWTGFGFTEVGTVTYCYEDTSIVFNECVAPTVGTKPNDPADESAGENWWFAPDSDSDGDGVNDGADTCPFDPTDSCPPPAP